MTAANPASDNLRGIALIVVAMAFFAATDACVKLGAEAMPKGQVMVFLGLGGAIIFSTLLRVQGRRVFATDFFTPALLMRNGADVMGTFCFMTALATVGIALPSAILQATPLAVTGLAVVLLGEKVGWRRWAAIVVGFSGVLIIIRPGATGFDPNALWAVAGMLFLALRDVSTRLMPPSTPSLRIAAYAMIILLPAGSIIAQFQGGFVPLTPQSGAIVMAASLLGAAGYFCIVQAMRTGEISVVAPFRYSRIFFALIIGYLIFGEQPDALTYLGCVVTIGAGLYTFLREARLNRRPVAPPL
ncbi:DMT family transporter [Aquicoccus porphyridii]|uniref:DMT family transporter n=1 Tax=Aquicoccus porphyridii TaxID=1852029 RepID=A0A5A9ZBX4_9RHOB|nr:DMT family transporter [Aquicoccus porphyridii]KAA0914683.1 DMT family transporter [Aquicoccus porphyridii]RAI53301.1 EamA/RhaT family transporter [Rhodobacteraceae bacterium AsT-22]